MKNMKNTHHKSKKRIKNLEDLRLAKNQIKRELKTIEDRQENSIVVRAFDVYKQIRHNQTFASSKIEKTLNWLGDKASEKYPLNGVTKIVISSLIVIAVPIITSKVQEFIKNKF